MFQDRNIIVGISGGIAVYKACALVSGLIQENANVKVIMTKKATQFVSPLTFQALSRNPVHVDVFDELDAKKIAHIDLADWADFFIIAPATANFVAQLANGLASDMLLTSLLATKAPVYIAPAMNSNMYENQAVANNLKTLSTRGYHFIEPGEGFLACGYIGKGRLEEPADIINAIGNHLQNNMLLEGKQILVSAGPTREMIDPIRFFSNRSSGKMGFAFAEAAAHFGAKVILVTGPTTQEVNHPNIKRIDVITAEEMYNAMHANFEGSQIVIKAAAVADYKPIVNYDKKMKKQEGSLFIEMERTKDILMSLGEQKKEQFILGFAAETNDILKYGIDKLKRKHLDAILINDVSQDGAGFEIDTNIVTYLNKYKHKTEFPKATKLEIAQQVLRRILQDQKGEVH